MWNLWLPKKVGKLIFPPLFYFCWTRDPRSRIRYARWGKIMILDKHTGSAKVHRMGKITSLWALWSGAECPPDSLCLAVRTWDHGRDTSPAPRIICNFKLGQLKGYVLVIILHSFNSEYRCSQRKKIPVVGNLTFSLLQNDPERGKRTAKPQYRYPLSICTFS